MNRKRKFTELSPVDEGHTYYSVDAQNHQLSKNLMENLKKEIVKESKIVKIDQSNDVVDAFLEKTEEGSTWLMGTFFYQEDEYVGWKKGNYDITYTSETEIYSLI